jgi:hypothetical protein
MFLCRSPVSQMANFQNSVPPLNDSETNATHRREK